MQSRQDGITSATRTLTSPTVSTLEDELPPKIRKRSGQEIPSREPFMQPTANREGTVEDPNMLGPSATSLGDEFAFPHDFLPNFLPTNDLQGLGGHPDLDLDGSFFDEMPIFDFAPKNRDLGTFRSIRPSSVYAEHNADLTTTHSVWDQSYPTSSSMDAVHSVPFAGSPGSVHGIGQEGLLPNGDLSPKALDRSTSSGTPCQCLHNIGMMLIELEAKSLVVENGTLDSMLASQKDFLSRCNSILDCQHCSMRAEYILLLGLLAQNLTNLCESTVNKFLEAVRRPSENHETLGATMPSRPLSETSDKVYLGRYEVELPQEWHTLMKVLIVMQLQNVQSLLKGMFKAASLGSNAEHCPMVERPCPTERRVIRLIQRLSQAT